MVGSYARPDELGEGAHGRGVKRLYGIIRGLSVWSVCVCLKSRRKSLFGPDVCGFRFGWWKFDLMLDVDCIELRSF